MGFPGSSDPVMLSILEEASLAPANPSLPSGLATPLRHIIPLLLSLGEKPGLEFVNPGLYTDPRIQELFSCWKLVLSKEVVSLSPSKSIKAFLLSFS